VLHFDDSISESSECNTHRNQTSLIPLMAEPQTHEMSIQTFPSHRFLPTQLEILQECLTDVKKLENIKDRHRLIKQVRKRVLDLPESQSLDTDDKEVLKSAINSWFSVRSKRQGNKMVFAKTWTARLVLYEEHKEEVNESKQRLYEEAKQNGDNPKTPFNFFQAAISRLWKAQTRDERKRLEKLANKWNKDGVSREQKQESVLQCMYYNSITQVNLEWLQKRHGPIRKNSRKTCTNPWVFGFCSSLQWKHPPVASTLVCWISTTVLVVERHTSRRIQGGKQRGLISIRGMPIIGIITTWTLLRRSRLQKLHAAYFHSGRTNTASLSSQIQL
jgi:hypothetical protein